MALSRLSMFGALPPYFGGKRRLLGAIFRHLPPPSESPVLADAFLGGGAVSLYAKARGYRVVANDIAERSCIVGRALIANDRVTLAPDDLLRLFVPHEANAGYVLAHHCPDVLPTRHGRFLDNALAVAKGTEEPKRSLLLLLLVKYLYRLRPMGNFGAKTIVHQVEEGRWDEVNPTFLKGDFVRRVTAHPKRLVEALRAEVNRGVFRGALPCEAHQGDVFDFLRSVDADVVFFDPPYAGTSAYETALRAVDSILAGREVEAAPSVFSGAGWLEAIERMFDSARHIPIWAMTFGNAVTDADGLAALMRKFRPHVSAEAITYAHCASLASAEARARNQELILIGRT